MEFINIKLSDIGEVVGGATPSTKNPDNYDGNIAWITPKDLAGYNKVYISKGERNITEMGFKSCSTKILPKNSVLFSSRAPIGYVAISENDLCTNQGFKSIIPNNKIDYKFLYYLLKHNKNYIASKGSGSTFKEVSGSVMKGIELSIPKNIHAQKKISKILFDIDKMIELNNEINNNLHELLKNQYYKMFVEGKKESWIDDKLGNYLSVDRGLSYKGQFLSETGVPMINLGNVMPNGVFRIEKNKYYSGDYKDKVTIKVGDIVIANTDMTQNREVIGTPIIVPPIYGDKIIFSHHIYGLRNLKLPKMYIFYTLLTDEWNAIAGGSATGTTVLALPKETIENYVVAIPDNKSLQLFDNIAETIQSKRNQILLENIKLEQLKDTLLPKLMNGEIDLDNIEI